MLGIDLRDAKQALALVDHDMRVLWRRSPRCAAHQLGGPIAEAAEAAARAGMPRLTVACEPTGSRWMQVQRLCREAGVALVRVQPLARVDSARCQPARTRGRPPGTGRPRAGHREGGTVARAALPSASSAAASIPANYLADLNKAGTEYNIPWTVLAAIGEVESGFGADDGRPAPEPSAPCSSSRRPGRSTGPAGTS